MGKVQSMTIHEFMSGSWKRPALTAEIKRYGHAFYSVNGIVLVALGESMANGSDDATFNNVWSAVMRAFDWGVVLVIAFAGACWGLGHRTKAIEILIGVCCGYILARHAKDIRDFLKGI